MSDARSRARAEVSTEEVTHWWRTAVSDIEPGVIRLRGYPVEEHIGRLGFADMVWLLLRGDLPTQDQATLLETALVAAVNHGPQAPSIAAARMAATCGVGLNNAVATGVNRASDTETDSREASRGGSPDVRGPGRTSVLHRLGTSIPRSTRRIRRGAELVGLDGFPLAERGTATPGAVRRRHAERSRLSPIAGSDRSSAQLPERQGGREHAGENCR
jgi:Citrate synthase, C-terminal domain